MSKTFVTAPQTRQLNESNVHVGFYNTVNQENDDPTEADVFVVEVTAEMQLQELTPEFIDIDALLATNAPIVYARFCTVLL